LLQAEAAVVEQITLLLEVVEVLVVFVPLLQQVVVHQEL
jgi:hypothetical protein